jgi:hypothetical protein
MVRAIPIHYNTPVDVLYGILDKIDGVHMTGGGLDLYNFTTGEWHPYYQTAKKIFDYATKHEVNAARNMTARKFIVTGIC